jgi:hypothetical protein
VYILGFILSGEERLGQWQSATAPQVAARSMKAPDCLSIQALLSHVCSLVINSTLCLDLLFDPAERHRSQIYDILLTNIINPGTGFGSGNTASPFGVNRSGFGATTNTTSGGGLFGSNTATSGPSTGFGGFGSNANNANSGGGMFGATNKPAFGAQNNTGGSLFGGGAGNNTFGQNNNQNTGAFGNTLGAALGTSTTECQGTGSTPFQVVQEKDNAAGTTTNHYQSVTFMQPYKNFCFEVSIIPLNQCCSH